MNSKSQIKNWRHLNSEEIKEILECDKLSDTFVSFSSVDILTDNKETGYLILGRCADGGTRGPAFDLSTGRRAPYVKEKSERNAILKHLRNLIKQKYKG